MTERVVVSDASCLVVLERTDEMLLLRQLFNEVRVTQEVAAEFGEALPEWIKVVEVKYKYYRDAWVNRQSGRKRFDYFC